MVEIGVTGTPFRAATIAAGAAMAAEADGAHAIWYPDAIDPALAARRESVEVAGFGLDPTDIADPLITVSAALLVARRVRVGILGWNPGAHLTSPAERTGINANGAFSVAVYKRT